LGASDPLVRSPPKPTGKRIFPIQEDKVNVQNMPIDHIPAADVNHIASIGNLYDDLNTQTLKPSRREEQNPETNGFTGMLNRPNQRYSLEQTRF